MYLNRFALKSGAIAIIRCYGTSTEPISVKVPLDVYGIRGRYATALYTAATKMNELHCVDIDLCELRYALKKNPKLMDLLTSPFINRNKMGEVLKEAAKEFEWSPATQNFLEIVSTNGRLKILPQILDSFEEIMVEHRREVNCKVTTVRQLDENELEKLKEALTKFIKPDQKIILETAIDPSIVGGMLVTIGDYFIDLSISRKVEMYKKMLTVPVD